MSWRGQLDLHYWRDGERTTAQDRHDGPLRVLQRLYPEGDAICHHVLVHPPGGVAGGDTLLMNAQLDAGSHAVITTPGATRFYKSAGEQAHQVLQARLEDHARLEWLPLETLAYPDCLATNRMQFNLAPTAQMMGWDVLALGLPAAGQSFDQENGRGQSSFTQEIEIPGVWLERGTVTGRDTLLLDSPLGWDGKRVMGTMWFAAGVALPRQLSDSLLEAARERISQHELSTQAGATLAHDQVIVVRALAERVEPLMNLLVQIWSTWRSLAWGVEPTPPRVWRT